MVPPPPLTALEDLPNQMQGAGWAVLSAASLRSLCAAPAADWSAWLPLWNDLPPDPHLRDGGGYRQRRHGCFTVARGQVHAGPRRAHWQPLDYNALHGGFERWFDPLPPALEADAAWSTLLLGLARVADALRPAPCWYGEAHMFRIDTGGAGGIGRPTPEGAHRDGVDLVAVVLVGRHQVKGGETRVFDARGPQGMRFTLAEPWSVLLLDDARVIHETTPIQAMQPDTPAWRDTLVVTLRQGGFQGPETSTP